MNNIPVLSKRCLVCGVEFCKNPSITKMEWREQTKYCSRKCSLTKTTISKQDHSNNPARQKGSIPWNKGEIYDEAMKSRLNMSGLEIGRGFMKGKEFSWLRGDKSARWIPPTEKPCAHCKKILLLKPNQIRDRNFCNRQCWALGTRGKGSPVYLGEEATSPLRVRIAELPEHKEWHSAILKQDDYTCQICHVRGGKLEVDHIKRCYLILKENNIRTIEEARNCQELWELKNGRCICRNCHLRTDTFGTRGLKNRKYKPTK